MKFWRAHKTKFFSGFVLALLIGGAVYSWYYLQEDTNISFQIFEVKRTDLERSIEATGTLEPETSVDLSFQKSGQIAEIFVDTGDEVKKNELLGTLESGLEEALLNQAQATLVEAQAALNLQLAKKTDEEIAISQADTEKAKADFDKASVELDNAKKNLSSTKKSVEQNVKMAKLALSDAQLNLDRVRAEASTTGGQNVSSVTNAMLVTKDAMGQVLSAVSSSIQTVDKLYGIYGSEFFVSVTDFYGPGGALYDSLLKLLTDNYNLRRDFLTDFNSLSVPLQVDKLQKMSSDILTLIQSTRNMLLTTYSLLDYVVTDSDFLPSDLNAYRSTVDATVSSFDLAVNTFNEAKSSLDRAILQQGGGDVSLLLDVHSAELAVERSSQALEKSKVDGQIQIGNAENEVDRLRAQIDIQRALLNGAQASLNKLLAAPRAVDTAPYRARVSQAQANVKRSQNDLDQTVVRSPIDGIVTLRDVEVGEQVLAGSIGNNIAFRVIDKSKFHLDVYVPETQIDKINLDSKVSIIFDAFESNEIFNGQIVSIEPGPIMESDIVYYKVKIMLPEADARLKPGMTANVSIFAVPKKDVLIVPERAVNLLEGKKTVFVLEADGTKKETEVRTGVRGNNGFIEITDGLLEGQKILINKMLQ